MRASFESAVLCGDSFVVDEGDFSTETATCMTDTDF